MPIEMTTANMKILGIRYFLVFIANFVFCQVNKDENVLRCAVRGENREREDKKRLKRGQKKGPYPQHWP